MAYALITGGWLSGGCYNSDAYFMTQATATEASDGGSGSGTASGSSASPTSSTTFDPATTTGDDTTGPATIGDATTGGTEEPDDLPTVSLGVSPMALSEAGPVDLAVTHSPDVTTLFLRDNGVEELSWSVDEAPPAYLITDSGVDGVHKLQVRGVNAENEEAFSEVVPVTTKMPAAGEPLWKATLDLAEPNEGRDLVSGIGSSGSIELLLGVDAEWKGYAARLSAEGEPAMVVAPLDYGLTSIGGVAHGPDGEAVVVGTEVSGDSTRMWIARVDPLGGVLDLDYGKLGDAATGVAVDRETGRIYVSGFRHTPDLKGVFDAMLWAHGPDGGVIWEHQWERPVANVEIKGAATDVAWDVALHPSADPDAPDDVIFVGESRLAVGNESPRYRAFARRYDAQGELLAAWLSSSPPLEEAGARSILALPEGVLVGGWSSANPESMSASTIFFLSAQLDAEATHLHGSEGAFEVIQDLQQLPHGEYVYVTDVDVDAPARHDVEVRALRKPASEFVWTRKLSAAEEVRGNALTVTPYGHVIVLSTEYGAGSSRIVLSAFHP
ncbi:MAG: hypothetical protein R3A79_14955 [Nannocystaceae bacterium]